MTIIPFDRLQKYILHRHEFEGITKTLQQTRRALETAETPQQRKLAQTARRVAITKREQLQEEFYVSPFDTDTKPDNIGQRLSRKLWKNLPLEDKGVL